MNGPNARWGTGSTFQCVLRMTWATTRLLPLTMESIARDVSVLFLLRQTVTYGYRSCSPEDFIVRNNFRTLICWAGGWCWAGPGIHGLFEYFSNSKFANYLCIPFFLPINVINHDSRLFARVLGWWVLCSYFRYHRYPGMWMNPLNPISDQGVNCPF